MLYQPMSRWPSSHSKPLRSGPVSYLHNWELIGLCNAADSLLPFPDWADRSQAAQQHVPLADPQRLLISRPQCQEARMALPTNDPPTWGLRLRGSGRGWMWGSRTCFQADAAGLRAKRSYPETPAAGQLRLECCERKYTHTQTLMHAHTHTLYSSHDPMKPWTQALWSHTPGSFLCLDKWGAVASKTRWRLSHDHEIDNICHYNKVWISCL